MLHKYTKRWNLSKLEMAMMFSFEGGIEQFGASIGSLLVVRRRAVLRDLNIRSQRGLRWQNGASSSTNITVAQLNQHDTLLKVVRCGVMALSCDTSRTQGQVVILRHRHASTCFEIPLKVRSVSAFRPTRGMTGRCYKYVKSAIRRFHACMMLHPCV